MKSVAVVGLSCRFPGGLDTVSDLWSAMMNKVNTADTVPSDRWDSDRYYSESADAPGKAYVTKGNFLKQDIKTFDAAFFDLPPRVAENLDPQQRLMLEVVWEAFENAGLDLPAHAGRNVGVYTGGFMLDHMITSMGYLNRSVINQNTAAGMMMTMLSNRISHAFDFRGPSLSIDTACSSSLTAFNYGFRDVQNGVADIAVVSGVNVMTRPEYPVGMCKGQFLSRDGQCKSFDSRGDGYGRGEGAGVVLLKDYDKALEDGDQILAKVVGAGVNSDGRTPGISMPSGDAQKQLIEDVLDEYQLDPHSVHYVECHGTGTAVGDPIETNSVGTALGSGRAADNPLVIGSIKSNIGHTEAAAGVAGVIKAVLTIQHRVVPPLGNFIEANPAIAFDELCVKLPIEATPLNTNGEKLRVAVNSFGYGGTNAHAVLEEVEATSNPSRASENDTHTPAHDFPRLLPISARSSKTLKTLAANFAELMESTDDAQVDDILYTASHRRAHLSHRAVVIGRDKRELGEALSAIAESELHDGIVTGDTVFGGHDAPVFVYTGMGPQWWGMGQELYRENALFRQTLDEADAAFQKVAGFSILAEMLKDESDSRITQTEYAQPGNFMVQCGLTRILQDAGVAAGAMVGHSVGEVSSAWASGVLSLEDAVAVSYHRSQSQAKTAGMGSMLAVGLGVNALEPYMEGFGAEIDIAAINGPNTVTVAGDTVSIRRLAEALTEVDVFNRQLQVEVPYHSHLMDSITGELSESLAAIRPSLPDLPLYSTVTGAQVNEVTFDADYWVRNVRQPVNFMGAITALMEEGYTNFIEVGPRPVLSAALKECARAAGKDIRLTETLRKGEPEVRRVHRAVAQAFANGARIDWGKHNATGQFTSLPNYPWQRELHWLETDRALAERIGSSARPMLGNPDLSAAHVWRNDVDHQTLAYLQEHVVTGVSVMPAAGYIEALFELGREVTAEGALLEIRDARIANPLTITPPRGVDFATIYDVETRTAAIRSAQIGSVGPGQLHMSAEVATLNAAEVKQINLGELVASIGDASSVPELYSDLATSGLQYGPAFQPITELYIDRMGRQAVASLELRPDLAVTLDKYCLHPTLLDGCFQMLMGILQGDSTTYLPTGFKSIRLLTDQSLATVWCHGRVISQTAKHIECDLTLYNSDGVAVAAITGMEATAGASREKVRVDKWGDPVKLFTLNQVWKQAGMQGEPRRLGAWLVVRDQKNSIADQLATRLEDQGAILHRVVTIGDKFEQEGPDVTIRAANEEDALKLVENAGPVEGILFAHGLDCTLDSDDPTGEEAIATMIAIAKAVSRKAVNERPRIYTVTKNAFAAVSSDSHVEPAQRAINGFVRVAHNEMEGCAVTTIDLPTRVDEDILDVAGAELLCDAAEDEIALRGNRRMMSVMEGSGVLDTPLIEERTVDGDCPIRARPAIGETAEAMVELVAMQPRALDDNDIRLQVQAMEVPGVLLDDTSRETLEDEYVRVVATVDEIGSAVSGMTVGERVYGFVPSDFASHVQGPRDSFHVVSLPGGVRTDVALEALSSGVVAHYAAEASGLGEGDRVVADISCANASAVADKLQELGAEVHRIGTDDAPNDAGTLDKLVSEGTHGHGFDAIVAPLQSWMEHHGTGCLSTGGLLVDTSDKAAPMVITEEVGNIIRTDMSVITGRSRRLHRILASMTESLKEKKGAGKRLSINISDLATQRLEIPPVDINIDVVFDIDRGALPVAVDKPIGFSSEGSFLITGGLGGFGMRTARWLADKGVRHLVLASRSGANTDEKRSFVQELESEGVTVGTPSVDLSVPAAVASLVEDIQKGEAPLKGVFHSAAVIEDEDLAEIDLDSYRRVMRSKATSADALHKATSDLDLDWFVLYSSVSNAVGNKRQAPYAAANGYLDGLAWKIRSNGQRAITINWGALGGAGVLDQDEATEQFLKYIGIRPLDVDEALTLMEGAMQRDVTQISILNMSSWMDWARYETTGAKSHRFATLVASDSSEASGANSEVREKMVTELAQLEPFERFDVLSGLVREVIGGELRVDPEALAIDRPINELGVDSLMAAEIQLVLENNLAVSIAVMDMLGGASIRDICDRTLIDFGFDENAGALNTIAAE